MPTEKEEIEDKGTASMGMLSELGLQDIQVRCVPAKMVFEHYLAGKMLDVDHLGLVSDSSGNQGKRPF